MAIVCLGAGCAGGRAGEPAAENGRRLASLPPATVTVQVSACGQDPEANRGKLQDAIDKAPSGATLVLPSGNCVVARCGVATGTTCPDLDGTPHLSALYVGGKSQLTILGAPDGSSVLTLDPHPPLVKGLPAYCGPAHVLTLHRTSQVTLRGFTLDGSNALLPQDANQCPVDVNHDGRLDEHMHLVRVLASKDLLVEQMKVNRAHGDGINLMGEGTNLHTRILPSTERVVVRNSDLFANHRSGVAFQRNVDHVTITNNTIRETEHGQDIDMEPTGDPPNFAPFDVTISQNVIERSNPTVAVALGGKGALIAKGVSFVNNVIRPPLRSAHLFREGGCLVVFAADQVTISDNSVVGASGCATIGAQRTTNLSILRNNLSGYANVVGLNGNFVPLAVIDVRERPEAQAQCNTSSTSATVQCYQIAYPDHLTVSDNTIVQHVPVSPGIRASNSEGLIAKGNQVIAAVDRSPAGPLPKGLLPSAAVEVVLGVPTLHPGDYYLNERFLFSVQTVENNQMRAFSDGLRLGTVKTGVKLDGAVIGGNHIDGPAGGARGIVIGPPVASPVPFVRALTVESDQFGCGFEAAPGAPLPTNAFVVPPGQFHGGDVGTVVPCARL